MLFELRMYRNSKSWRLHKVLHDGRSAIPFFGFFGRKLRILGSIENRFSPLMDENLAKFRHISYIFTGTVGSKIIRALAIVLFIFLWFDCQFLSAHACYKQYKA